MARALEKEKIALFMQLEISKDYLTTLKDLLDSGNAIKIREFLIELHPADIAAIINQIGNKYIKNSF